MIQWCIVLNGISKFRLGKKDTNRKEWRYRKCVHKSEPHRQSEPCISTQLVFNLFTYWLTLCATELIFGSLLSTRFLWDKNSSFYTPRSRSNGGEPLLVTRAALRYTARPPFAYLLVALIVGTLDLICCVFLARPSMLRVKAECVLCTVSLQDAAKRRNWPHRQQTKACAGCCCT